MIKNNNQKAELDKTTKQILLGGLLGDGSLAKFKKSKNSFYREVHSLKQKDYLLWKQSKPKYFSPKVHECSNYDKRTNKEHHRIILWSKVHPILTNYHNLLYNNRKKNITEELLNQINNLGLAVWYMDDGYYHYSDYRCGFGTDCYTYEEQLLIKNWLKKKFNLQAQIHKRAKKNTNSYTIVLPRNEADKLLRIIEPYILRSMHYKLGHLKEKNLLKIQEHKNKAKASRKLAYQRNKEKDNEHTKAYYKTNKENLIKKAKERYLKNKEKILKQKKKYYLENKLMIRNKQKLYNQNNKEKISETSLKYYYNNREKILIRSRDYLNKNKEKINKRRRERYRKNHGGRRK